MTTKSLDWNLIPKVFLGPGPGTFLSLVKTINSRSNCKTLVIIKSIVSKTKNLAPIIQIVLFRDFLH